MDSMSKFGNILLRIIIVLSFVGIVVFVGIAIFNNQNIAFEAYNYIVATQSSKDFNQLQTNIRNKFKATYDGLSDTYANFIDSAITELNEGIDYFIDYLVFEDKITKGEQDKLTSLYKNYVKSFEATEESYSLYTESYEDAKKKIEEDHEYANYAKELVNKRAVYVVRNYYSCFTNGSDFFKYLTKIVNKYNMDNSGYFSYKGQSYMIKVGLVDYANNFILDNMDKKERGQTYETSATANALVNTYYSYLANAEDYNDSQCLTNNDFREFKNNLNSLDIFEWAGNYENYTATLTEDLKTKSSNALSFFNNKF